MRVIRRQPFGTSWTSADSEVLAKNLDFYSYEFELLSLFHTILPNGGHYSCNVVFQSNLCKSEPNRRMETSCAVSMIATHWPMRLR